MTKQFTLTEARLSDIRGDAEKYLPIAMYTIGCHMDQMSEEELEGLMYAISTELQERDRAKEFEGGPQQWDNTQNFAYCEGHNFT